MIFKHTFFIFCLFGAILFANNTCVAQTDTVIVKQGDQLTGEMVSFDRDVLHFKTSYSSETILLNWNEIIALKAYEKFRVLTNNGKIYIGSLRIDSAKNSTVLTIITPDHSYLIKRADIQEISRFDKKLSDRLRITADLGVIVTKANNSDQASFEIAAQYLAQRWEFDFDYSGYASTVDTIKTNRANLGLTAKYNFPEKWFLILRLNSFKSTEQQLDYRVNYFVGAGKYILKNRHIVLWGYTGATYNREKFTANPKAFKTAEAFGGFHFEASPFERFSIISELLAYPSLSDWGRLRMFSKTDAMFSFARHFRFGLGYVLNTDNKPPVNTSKSDYLFNAKLGWSL
jgi:Protein of unknown function, DUF481